MCYYMRYYIFCKIEALRLEKYFLQLCAKNVQINKMMQEY